MSGETVEEMTEPSCCCISHEFYKAAQKDPEKIAVVHARGGAKIARQHTATSATLRDQFTACDDNESDELDKYYENGFDELMETTAVSIHPPVYEGDQCFTYSEISAAVESLSIRLRTILDGGDDPYLIKPTSGSENIPSERVLHDVIYESSVSSISAAGFFEEKQNVCIPKIVGIYMPPSVQYVVSVLSVLRCGEAFVPLDPSWPKERILSVLYSSKTNLIVWHDSSMEKGYSQQFGTSNWLLERSGCPSLFVSMEFPRQVQLGALQCTWPCENKRLRLFCYLMYTSGSTGKPKGVCGTEIGLLNRFSWMQELYPLHGGEHLLFKTSISFIDHMQEFLGALLTTCTLIIPPFNELRENLFCIVDYMKAYSINRLVAVPSLLRAILPSLLSPCSKRVLSSLRLLVLSGEVFHLSLWDNLSRLLPKTTILNLYGSTEVSGDCTYFDCKKLPLILESEEVSSVPIGMPLSNCDIVLIGKNAPFQGEICVRGQCVARGCFNFPSIMPLDCRSPQNSCCSCSLIESRSQLNSTTTDWDCSIHECTCQYYFKTGDFARRLSDGDLVYLGRRDRTINVNGKRVALEEVENTLREHPDVVDAAVVFHEVHGDLTYLEAYLVTKRKRDRVETLIFSIRSWLISKLPQAMIPHYFTFCESLPMSLTGKVDYTSLAGSKFPIKRTSYEKKIPSGELLLIIKKVFSNALMLDEVSDYDDFFEMGGNSISAAHASYNLGIDMRWLYDFPSPLKLQVALSEKEIFSGYRTNVNASQGGESSVLKSGILVSDVSKTSNSFIIKHYGRLYRTPCDTNADNSTKYLKIDTSLCIGPEIGSSIDGIFWNSSPMNLLCSFSRCNQIRYRCENEGFSSSTTMQSLQMARNKKGSMREIWKVHMESCVDASPLVVFTKGDSYLFIGSHSHKFLCVEAKSGFIRWEVKLEGRVECSAAILEDFSQVVVGCYEGKIYFLDFSNGSICSVFQTCGVVKSQPIVDKRRHLIWCGSYDHYLYALDYRNYSCTYKLGCGGSIFGSPAIDEVHNKLYVASTNGRMTALSIKEFPFYKLWLKELEAPIFGSLSVNPSTGNVICCLVDGHVVAVDMYGSIIWRVKTGGPIFAAPCTSCALPSQVLICSRDGNIYSFDLENGDLLWEHYVGNPITSSAYVDENLELQVKDSILPESFASRLVCVAASSGYICLLRINLRNIEEINGSRKNVVEEFARLDLQGDLFSSPVMISGRIFIGCRDDYVHCIGIGNIISSS